MKFVFEYRTSDNVRHEDVITAPDREAAFSELRARGIKPGRLVEAPGLLNKLFGKGKRWMLIVFLTVVAVLMWLALRDRTEAIESANAAFEGRVRRQIIGDTAVIEKGIRTGWEDVFQNEGERFLASFAVPGVPAGLRNTSEPEIMAALGREVRPSANASIEERQIKSIVEGMKDELRRFISKGGTVVEYGRRLVSRQEQEIRYYTMAKTEVESAKKAGRSENEIIALWSTWNNRLRQMGIRLVSMPE